MPEANGGTTRRQVAGLLPRMLRPASGRHRKAAASAAVMFALAAGAVPALLHGASTARTAKAPLMSYRVCTGWAGCDKAGFNSYGYGAHEWTMWWRSYPGNNCTNYTAYVESAVFHAPTPGYLLGNGGQWAANAAAHGVPVNGTPSVGAIAVWYGGNHPGLPRPGHTAVVEQVGPNSSWIVISQQNISGDVNGYDWQFIRKGSAGWQAWPDKFVHFPIPRRAALGYYNSATLTANLRDTATAGPVNTSFGLGTKGTIPLVGNWSSTGKGRAGYYDPATGTFYLHNVSTTTPNITVTYGPPGVNVTPLTGDWTGTGTAGIGYYDPATGTFHLRQALSAGADDYTIHLGPAAGGVIPLAGDWTGGKANGIGYYDPKTATFTLATLTTATTATTYKTFKFGPAGMVPVTGDWFGGKIDYAGYYNPRTGTFYLRNSLTSGAASTVVHLGPANMIPLTGDWFGG